MMDTNYIIHDGDKYVKLEQFESLVSENHRLEMEYEHALAENRTLRTKSDIDPLSKVYRRPAAIEHINAILEKKAKNYSLTVLDLDNFKIINDSLGHSYGDAVISVFAESMRKEIGEKGIIGRFGGDEFFIFIPNMELNDVVKHINNVIHRTEGAGENFEDSISIGCSAGIAYSDTGTSYKDLFLMADKALYYAKNNGKGRAAVFSEDMQSLQGGGITYMAHTETENDFDEIVARALESASRASTSDEAVERLVENIHLNFNIDMVNILMANTSEDSISVLYRYNYIDEKQQRLKNNVGYYLHKDLVSFRTAMPNRCAISSADIDARRFSPKLRKEIIDTDNVYRILYMHKSTEDTYTFCCFESSLPTKYRSDDDFRAITEIISVAMVYTDKIHRTTRREKALLEDNIKDKLTGSFILSHFFEESGRIRKFAEENNKRCYIVEVNPLNLTEFNLKYSYSDGDIILKEITQSFNTSNYSTKGLISHELGRFYAIASIDTNLNENDVYAFTEHRLKKILKKYQLKYPEFKLRIKLGVAYVAPDELLLRKMDEAKMNGKIIEA